MRTGSGKERSETGQLRAASRELRVKPTYSPLEAHSSELGFHLYFSGKKHRRVHGNVTRHSAFWFS